LHQIYNTSSGFKIKKRCDLIAVTWVPGATLFQIKVSDINLFKPYRYFRTTIFFITNKLLVLKSQTTNDLALRLRNDDINAFNTLYWEYHAAVYANALKLIKDPAIAEDIVQEVFVTLWGKRHTIDPELDIAGWLFVISHNKTVDQLKRKLRYTLAQKNLSIFKEDHSIIINTDLKEEQLCAIERAMDQLSPQKRKVFELCKVQGRTYKKAAEELHISKYTVKEYLSEALVSIKKYVGEHPRQTGIVIYFLVFSVVFL
jgi:RNA polymerase sigma-70 factor (ECF subfamily)